MVLVAAPGGGWKSCSPHRKSTLANLVSCLKAQMWRGLWECPSCPNVTQAESQARGKLVWTEATPTTQILVMMDIPQG